MWGSSSIRLSRTCCSRWRRRATERIRFGPLVTPVMFRPPSNVGRLAAQLDLLSGGRFVLGLGVGWGEAEHRTYGVDWPRLGERFDRLDEYIQVMRAMWGEGPASFEGDHYRLSARSTRCRSRSRDARPVLIGGGGEKRTLKLVAKYAAEWNSVDLTPEVFRHKCEVLAAHCADVGRDPATIRRSMTTIGFVGATDEEVEEATLVQMQRTPPPGNPTPAEYRAGDARGRLDHGHRRGGGRPARSARRGGAGRGAIRLLRPDHRQPAGIPRERGHAAGRGPVARGGSA